MHFVGLWRIFKSLLLLSLLLIIDYFSGPWGEQIPMLSSSRGSVILLAGHKFKDLATILREGDVISFIASFERYPIKYPPKLNLLKLECIHCKKLNSTIESVVDISYLGLWAKIYHAFKFLFNFLLGPLFVFDL